MPDNSSTLKPCPFCGGSDVRRYPSNMTDGPPRVICCTDDCGADMEADQMQQAVERWNRRV